MERGVTDGMSALPMKRNDLSTIVFMLLPPGFVVALYSYLGYFSRFIADDFCSFNDARRFKLLRYIWHWYNNWGGRYSSIATDNLLDKIGVDGLRFVPLVVLLLWTFAISAACRKLLQKTVANDISIWASMSFGVLIIFVTVSTSPGVETALYWWSGMRTYVPPLISLTLHLAFLFWAMDRASGGKQMLSFSLFSFLLALFSGGYNETFTVVQFLFFLEVMILCVALGRMRFADRLFRLPASAVAGSALALAIMIVSPGAARRQTFFPPNPDLMTILKITSTGYPDYLFQLFGSLDNILAYVALVVMATWIGTHTKTTAGLSGKVLFSISLASSVFLSLAAILPSVYGLGKMPAQRTLIVTTYIVVLGLASAGLMIGRQLTRSTSFIKPRYLHTGLFLLVLISIPSAAWVTFGTVYEKREIYASFAREWDELDSRIKQASQRGDESITIPVLQGWMRADHPNENPKFWATRCYSDYYGIQVYGPPYGP